MLKGWLHRKAFGGRPRVLGNVIRTDRLDDALDVVAYVFIVLLAVFAVNYGSLYLGLIFLVSLGMQVSAPNIARRYELGQKEESITRRSVGMIWYGIGGCLIAFLLLDAAIPPFYGYFSTRTLATIPLTSVSLIGAILVVVNSIPEENFFRYALANLYAKYLGPFWAIVLDAFSFMFFHIPIDASSVINIVIIFGAGAVIAFFGFLTGRLSVCKVAHMLNNAISLGYLTVLMVYGVH